VALTILEKTLGMVPIESPNLFGAFRNQMNGLLWGFMAITIIVWALAMVLMGLVFSMAANERRREIAVLKALGASRRFIFSSILTEAAILAFSGAFLGISLSGFGLYIFKDYIAGSLKMPFLFPSIASFLSMFGGGIAIALLTVTLAAFYPALMISRQEAAIAMRE
jgi:putative ABC transport system permease protein